MLNFHFVTIRCKISSDVNVLFIGLKVLENFFFFFCNSWVPRGAYVTKSQPLCWQLKTKVKIDDRRLQKCSRCCCSMLKTESSLGTKISSWIILSVCYSAQNTLILSNRQRGSMPVSCLWGTCFKKCDASSVWAVILVFQLRYKLPCLVWVVQNKPMYACMYVYILAFAKLKLS